MADCSAQVTASFSEDGIITFTIEVQDCIDSSGRFEFEVSIDQGEGKVQTLQKRENWTRTHDNSTVTLEYTLDLQVGETILNVNVDSDGVECICYS